MTEPTKGVVVRLDGRSDISTVPVPEAQPWNAAVVTALNDGAMAGFLGYMTSDGSIGYVPINCPQVPYLRGILLGVQERFEKECTGDDD